MTPLPDVGGTAARRDHPSSLVALTAAATLLVAGCARPYHEASWPDLVTARQQDAIERGWVPEFLPEAATDVRQRNEPATGARIVVASLPTDVAVPECSGTSSDPVPLDATWFPADPGEPTGCPDGWTMARSDATVALWNLGDMEPVPNDS